MARFQIGNNHGRRWRKGQSGNPRGRPRIKPVRAALREMLDGAIDDDGRTAADRLAMHAYGRAMSRERDALAWMVFIRSCVEGLPGNVPDDDDAPETDGKQTAAGRPGHEPHEEKPR